MIEDSCILELAISKYGQDVQKNVAIEEMSELTKEICKDKRGNLNKLHMAEEIADVEIMISQLKLMYKNENLVEVYKSRKMKRLMERIGEQ